MLGLEGQPLAYHAAFIAAANSGAVTTNGDLSAHLNNVAPGLVIPPPPQLTTLNGETPETTTNQQVTGTIPKVKRARLERNLKSIVRSSSYMFEKSTTIANI